MFSLPENSLCKALCRVNPVNTVTNGTKMFGRNNEVILLTRVSLQENGTGSFLLGGPKRVDVITRCPYYQGRFKAGFYCA